MRGQAAVLVSLALLGHRCAEANSVSASAADPIPTLAPTLLPDNPVQSDCANAYLPNGLMCANNSTLFHYIFKTSHTTSGTDQSCAHCVCNSALLAAERTCNEESDYTCAQQFWGDCCAGWSGTQCDVCTALDACPARVVPPATEGAEPTVPLSQFA